MAMGAARAKEATQENAGGRASTQRDRKIASILAAARELFLDHGFDTITMDMVARQAQVSKATLYAHFASKEELFTAVMVDEANLISAEIWQIAPERGDVRDVLRHVAQKFVEIFLSERAMFLRRAIVGAVPRFPSIGEAMFNAGPKAMTERLAKFLTEAHQKGLLDVRNPVLAANQFLSTVRGDLDIRGLLLPETHPSRQEIDVQIETGIDLFLHFYASAERR
ncbi:TetR/AcrR family transcriptional regulator [Labrys portucalensis]|uniref:TetR/AcrR family transcriptional regulator n=1 Tax=Labrys neptuniae TaxID=376174 RepID=A0ABV6ZRF2_9HYPH